MAGLEDLVEAWRADPRPGATIRLCELLTRVAEGAPEPSLVPTRLIAAFASEASARNAREPDALYALTDLYLAARMAKHAVVQLALAEKAAPGDPRARERKIRLGLAVPAASAPSEPETLDVPTAPLDPPTEPTQPIPAALPLPAPLEPVTDDLTLTRTETHTGMPVQSVPSANVPMIIQPRRRTLLGSAPRSPGLALGEAPRVAPRPTETKTAARLSGPPLAPLAFDGADLSFDGPGLGPSAESSSTDDGANDVPTGVVTLPRVNAPRLFVESTSDPSDRTEDDDAPTRARLFDPAELSARCPASTNTATPPMRRGPSVAADAPAGTLSDPLSETETKVHVDVGPRFGGPRSALASTPREEDEASAVTDLVEVSAPRGASSAGASRASSRPPPLVGSSDRGAMLPADEDASAVTDLVEIAPSRAAGLAAGGSGHASMKRASLPPPPIDDEDDDSGVRTDIVEVSSPRGANAAGAPAKGSSSSSAGLPPGRVPSSPAPLPLEPFRPAETPPALGAGLPSLVPPPDPDDSHDDRPVRTRILDADEALAARQSDPWPKHVVPRGSEGPDAANVRGRIFGAGTTPSFEPSPAARPVPRFGPPPSFGPPPNAPIEMGTRLPSYATGPTYGLPHTSAPTFFGAPPGAPADPLARSQPPTSSPFFGVPPGAPADPLARSQPPTSSPFFGAPPGAPVDPMARSQPPTSLPWFGAPRVTPPARSASWSLDDAPRWLAVVVGLVLAGVVVVVGWFVARWVAAGSL